LSVNSLKSKVKGQKSGAFSFLTLDFRPVTFDFSFPSFILHPSSFILAALLLNLLLAACGLDNATTSTPPTATPYPGFKGGIMVGGIFDLSGTTSDEGREYAKGVQDYVSYFNSNGGAAGYKIDLRSVDYAYKATVAIEAYQKLVKEGAVAFIGWTHSDTLALTSQLGEGKTPFFSASYRDDVIRDIKKNPYNFFVTPTYSDQMRMSVQFVRILHPEPGRRLGVAHLLVDNDFGRYPLQAGRNYAADNNIFWYHEGFLNPTGEQNNIVFEINRLKAARPDWTLIQADNILTAKLLKEIKQAGVDGRFAGMPTTGGPDLLALAGPAAEGYYVGVTLPYATDESPGMVSLRKWWTTNRLSNRPGSDPQSQELQNPSERYIQGWVTANVLLEGIKQAALKGSVTSGDAVKSGLETLENYTADGLLPPLTYTATNHKGTQIHFYRVTGGRWQPFIGDISLADLEKQPYQVTPMPPTPTPRR